MSQTVVQTILGENFMHDAEQGLDLASVVENEVCFSSVLSTSDLELQFNKEYHTKVLPNSFHLNGHTSGLSTDSKVGTTFYRIVNHVKILPNGFDLNGELVKCLLKN